MAYGKNLNNKHDILFEYKSKFYQSRGEWLWNVKNLKSK